MASYQRAVVMECGIDERAYVLRWGTVVCMCTHGVEHVYAYGVVYVCVCVMWLGRSFLAYVPLKLAIA